MTTQVMEAVLFDLDGTLVSTRRLYLEAYRRAVEPHLDRLPTAEEIIALRPRAELRFLHDLVPPERYEACLRDFRRVYRELHDTHFGGIYPGVEAMLAELRRAGVRLGIVTGKSRSSWEVMQATVELGAFDVAIFDDDVAEPKPDPRGILAALESVGAAPAAAAYVGDSVSDAEAAAAAGVLPLAALWAKKPEEREAFLERVRPFGARAVATPRELLALVL